MNWKELNKHSVKVYITTWCPDCHRLRDIFNKNKLNYEEIDIDNDPEAAKYLKEKTGKTAIPYVEIDGEIMIRGWHSESASQWDEKIFFNEIENQIT